MHDGAGGYEAGPAEQGADTSESAGADVMQVERVATLRWEGEVPPQKWMNFYTRVVSRFATGPGLKLKVEVEAAPGEGITQETVEDTKRALRELGLGDSVSAE